MRNCTKGIYRSLSHLALKRKNFLCLAKTCRLHAIVYKTEQQPPNAAVPVYSLLTLHFGIF